MTDSKDQRAAGAASDALRQGSEFLVAENARLVAANTSQAERIASLEASVTSLEDRLRGERAAADTFLAANTTLKERVAALEGRLSGMVERIGRVRNSLRTCFHDARGRGIGLDAASDLDGIIWDSLAAVTGSQSAEDAPRGAK